MTADTRYRVRADAFYVRHGDGVRLRNNTGSFSINGAGAYDLVATLFANLDGQATMADLVDGLPDAARGSVERLVATLRRNGFLKEVDYPAEVVPDWMRRDYAAHLAFLDHHADHPVARFTRVRTRRVACVGAGRPLRAVLAALAEFGIATVEVVTPEPDVETIENALARDPRLRWHTTVHPLNLDTAAALPEARSADVVLLAADIPGIADAQQALIARGQAVGIVGRHGDFTVGVPPGGPCWECVHRSIAGRPRGVSGDFDMAAAPTAIAALAVVRHTFALLAGVDIDGTGSYTTVEPMAPVVRAHVGREHPDCARHPRPRAETVGGWRSIEGEPVRPDLPASGDPAHLVAVSDRIVAVTTAWTDPVSGPLLALGEGDADQVPLSVSRCRVADRRSTASAPVDRLVECLALSAREARNQVVLAAVEALAGSGAAGWSRAEAVYRAVAALALRLPATEQAWTRVSGQAPADRRVRGYLLDVLGDRRWCAKAVEVTPTGLTRATVRLVDETTAVGVGVDEGHAVDNALLAAAAGGRPVAHLAPPVAEWADALPDADLEVTDLSARLPFLDGAVFVMAARLRGDR